MATAWPRLSKLYGQASGQRWAAPDTGERHLRRILKHYFAHYHRWRCHQSFEMDCPEPRPVQPPEVGAGVAVPEAGGLYRHYERLAA